VVVDAKVADTIDAFSGSLRRANLLDDKCSCLLPATIAARSLTSFQRHHHPLRQRGDRIEERAPHGGKHVPAHKHVPLHREPVSNHMPRPIHAVTPCECSGSPVSGHRPHLAEFAIIVLSERLIERDSRIPLHCQRT
jgi:hypothetical protein